MHPFTCPKCGYRNYLTRDDQDRQHVAAMEALKRMQISHTRYERWQRIKSRLRLAFGLNPN